MEVKTEIKFSLNKTIVCSDCLPPTTTLLEFLRQRGWTGTKEGCGDGDCGACTVVLLTRDYQGNPCYEAVNSCLLPIGALDQRQVWTVDLHPVQEALVQTVGSQCGYCTPGFVMSMFADYYQGRVDDSSIEGNLCRCTGYLPIRRACEMVDRATPRDDFAKQLTLPWSKINSFAYVKAEYSFLLELFSLWQDHPGATLMAGGTDLGIDFSHYRRPYPVIIALEGIEELQEIEETSAAITIGSGVTLSHLAARLRGQFLSLDTMLSWFAARQVRNRATIGGNLATASPIGDLLPVLLSLDARIELVSPNQGRWVPVSDFFRGYRQTALQPQEMIRSVCIPKNSRAQRLNQSYKVGKRGTDDISIISAAFTIDVDQHHRILHARLAYGGVAPTPVRAIAEEEELLGKVWNHQTVLSVKPLLYGAFQPLTDLRGSASYRWVYCRSYPSARIHFVDLVKRAYADRVSLSASGYYRTPNIFWDHQSNQGRPFYYFAFGAAMSEVEVDGFTGTFRLVRVDIVHDVGASLHPLVDRGQIEGGFVQGMGWLTMEELVWNDRGHLLTHAPSTYKIPTIGKIPSQFQVQFLDQAPQEGTIFGSKAIGGPPLMLAISVREAIRAAIAAFGKSDYFTLACPATPEAILRAIGSSTARRLD